METPSSDDVRYAIVLHAGAETHEGMARALHALLYAKEMLERGVRCRLVFDGAGSEWAAKLLSPETDSERRMAKLFDFVKEQGLAYEVCDYCAGAFAVRDRLLAEGAPLSSQYMDHPSIAGLVAEGYRLLVL